MARTVERGSPRAKVDSLARAFMPLAFVLGCAPREERPAPHDGALIVRAPASAPAETASTAPSTTTHVALLERATLQKLATRGFSLGQLLAGSDATSTAELASLPGPKSIFDELSADVASVSREQPLARVTSVDGFRVFDRRWLDSKATSFELVGVFNRLDRQAFYQQTCGEVRFVYRLRFEIEHGGEAMVSRLPLTLNVVFFVEGEQCAELARSWRAPAMLVGSELADYMIDKGALSAARRASFRLKSVETNLQRFRVQSFAQETTAGHIEYGLTVFHPLADGTKRFAPAAMENMPDVDALQRDRPLRAELLSYLKTPAALASADRGVLQLPERFLARRATSVSPRGLGRLANRPFRRLFSPSDFADAKLDGALTMKTGAAVLRRLDGATCVGCHQSRAIAGFHFIGHDSSDELLGAALQSGASPHLTSDLERRRLYVDALADGAQPSDMRPIPERQGVGQGFGAPCGLGEPGFADWSCATGLVCKRLEDDEIGICIGDSPLAEPCEYGRLLDNQKPQKDYVGELTRRRCSQSLVCHNNKSGFPMGACEAACTSADPLMACATFVDTDALQACLRLGKPYGSCNQASALPVGMRACDDARPCRQDYVCARTQDPLKGACVPPYFVFPLRLDGFPLKR